MSIYRDTLMLAEAYNRIALQAQLPELAEQFCNEFLSAYKKNRKGTHNCAWTTQQFIKWSKSKGIDAKAIYLVWPERSDDSGESHIAPVVNNTIIDFTFKYFEPSFDDCAKITPVNEWQSVYSKFGYGENTVEINGKRVSHIVDTFDNIKAMKEIGGIETIIPSDPL